MSIDEKRENERLHTMKVLIVSTNENLALIVLRCLSALGIRACVMGVSTFHPIRLSRYCDDYLRYELRDLLEENDSIIDDINNYCKQKKLDIIIPTGIDGTLFLSKVREKMTEAKVFPIDDIGTLKILNNKWRFWKLISKNGVPCPKTLLINDMCQLKSLNLEFPVIIKQLELEGSIGIAKLNSQKELEIYMSNGKEFNALPLLIQEYIPGIDMCLNVLAKNGKIVAWSAQKYYLNKNIIEFVKDDNILDIGKKIVSCCNYTGVANIDMRLDDRDKSFKIIECNPRFWYSADMSMLSGVNFPYLGIRIVQGDIPAECTNCRDIRYFSPKMLIFETLKNLSLKDVHEYNLYFLRQTIYDPLSYFYVNMITLTSYFKFACKYLNSMIKQYTISGEK